MLDRRSAFPFVRHLSVGRLVKLISNPTPPSWHTVDSRPSAASPQASLPATTIANTMGLSFRKSVKVGPFRLNFSTRGVGYSVGGAGFRTGVSPSGRSYTTFSAPGTGLSYRTTGGKGCVLFFLGLGGAGSAAWALTRFIS